MEEIELEINKERACCRDVMTAINRHLEDRQYPLAQTRMNDLQKSINYIEVLENELKEQNRNKLFEVARELNRNGWKANVVRLDAVRR
ncbi:hypothetical protein [Sporosarcina sp. FSL K6-1508]|uniref:hypothetical protein n=1 Tax=Sporosarcina sp. FSL K6-1508 TaxID=2921553 RepID=UPI0030F60EC1